MQDSIIVMLFFCSGQASSWQGSLGPRRSVSLERRLDRTKIGSFPFLMMMMVIEGAC